MTPEEQITALQSSVNTLTKDLQELKTVKEALKQSEDTIKQLKADNAALSKELTEVKATNLLLAGRKDIAKAPIERQLDDLFGKRKEIS